MRPIKFRAWDKKRKKFMKVMLLHVSEEKGVFAVTLTDGKGDIPAFIDDIELLQFTGRLDKDGVEIYEGDKLIDRVPIRSTQTHYGENIPRLDGKYTEPLEPEIETREYTVMFKGGVFGVEQDDDSLTPLDWLIGKWTLEGAKEAFSGGWVSYGDSIPWDDPEEGDLQYLLETYNLESESALIQYLGIKVIGNRYQHPELLEAP